jgi:hypothetical protein
MTKYSPADGVKNKVPFHLLIGDFKPKPYHKMQALSLANE